MHSTKTEKKWPTYLRSHPVCCVVIPDAVFQGTQRQILPVIVISF